MAINYTWEIRKIEKVTLGDIENVVTNIEYYKIGTDDSDNTSAKFAGMCTYDPNEIQIGDNFIPYENLTEEQVLTWIQDKIASDATMEKNINDFIEKRIRSKRVSIDQNLPWQNN